MTEEIIIGSATVIYSHLWYGVALGILVLIMYIVTRSKRGGAVT